MFSKEGRGKATSSAVAMGTMGGREETTHTIEKALDGGREGVKDWATETEVQDEDWEEKVEATKVIIHEPHLLLKPFSQQLNDVHGLRLMPKHASPPQINSLFSVIFFDVYGSVTW